MSNIFLYIQVYTIPIIPFQPATVFGYMRADQFIRFRFTHTLLIWLFMVCLGRISRMKMLEIYSQYGARARKVLIQVNIDTKMATQATK